MTNSAQPPAPHKKSFWTPTRLTFTFTVLALVAAFMLPSCRSDAVTSQPNNANQPSVTVKQGTAPQPAQPAQPAQPLPATVLNMELKDLGGKTFKLSDYAGKVVIVNLWATWCGPCRIEIPELIKLSEEYKARGVELIGVTNEDPVEDEAKVKDFVAKQNIPYRIVWGTESYSLGLMQGNVRNVIPQSFIITGDGRVVGHFTGFNPTTTPQKLRAALDQALNTKS
jgi:thiol-disulfide isomerase/thioredoxin